MQVGVITVLCSITGTSVPPCVTLPGGIGQDHVLALSPPSDTQLLLFTLPHTHQMDPPVYSDLARQYGLHVSLLVRLYDHEAYDSGMGQLCKTLLTKIHRTHQQVTISSSLSRHISTLLVRE